MRGGNLVYNVSQEIERKNCLLISLIRPVALDEISKCRTIDDVDFDDKNSLVGKLFRRIFKSQETNIDSLCCIVADMINKFMNQKKEGSFIDGQDGFVSR